MELKFHTSLTKDECIKRLNSALKQKFFSGGNLIVGKVNSDNFHLREPQYSRGLWGFDKKFSGCLKSVSDGTEVIGNLSAMTAINISFVVVIIFALLVASDSLKDTSFSLILLGIFVVLGFLSFLLRDKGYSKIDFIKKTLNASQVD